MKAKWKSRFICLTLTAVTSVGMVAQNAPLFQFSERPGPHAVGLKVVEQYDLSRTYRKQTDDLGKPYVGERARPLQTLIWYPADRSSAGPMTYGDYARLFATETSFGNPPPVGFDEAIKTISLAPTAPLWAVRDAQEKSGHFPIVIYAPSFGNVAWENADLCEYLASYGYVVLASPDMGATTREMTSDVSGANAQARDISFLIGYAQTLSDTDMSEIAVAGYSWGGLSNLFAAARDNRIDALVALDGSMRYWPGLVEQAGDVHPDQMALPMLFFTENEITLEEAAADFAGKNMIGPSVLNAWTHGDLITVHMLGMTHQEFCAKGQRVEDVWRASHEAPKSDYTREDAIAGYGWVAQYTLQFLNAYLKHDTAAMEFLKNTPAENGPPKHFMSVSYRAAKGVPGTLDAFRAELGRQGFDHAAEVYAATQKDNRGFKLEEADVNAWAHRLMSNDHLPEAIALFKLNVQDFPDSADAYDSMGDAYMKSGQKQLAIDCYATSLQKNPDNENAKQKLKELQNPKPNAK
jgi:dienelactone hydrolase